MLKAIAAILITGFALAGCGGGAGGGGGGGGNSDTPVSISVTPTNPNISPGETLQFIAIGTYSNGATAGLTRLVTWRSLNEAVATISNISGSEGLATSIAAGSTTIIATYGSVSGDTTLTVRTGGAVLDSISVTPASAKIARGETEQFKATGTYSDGTTGNLTTSVTWESSDTAVATISNEPAYMGLATSIAAGSTTITATSGSISGDTTLTVEAGVTGAVNIPETGQTMSYATRDDGGLQKGVAWPSPRFSSSGDCVTDNLTGLMWVKNPVKTKRIWEDAIAFANGLTLCGYDDWRLPNINELESLYHAGEGNSARWLDTQGFIDINKMEGAQWSSTTYASNTYYAWSVIMWNGTALPIAKWSNIYLWPVRGGQGTVTAALPKTGQTTGYATGDDGGLEKGVAWPSPRFSISGDCVTDSLTGLMWVSAPGIINLQWREALDYTNDFFLCGYTDWRLPNRREIRSLMNYGESDPAAWLNTQGFSTVRQDYYWTSTTYAANTDEPIAWSLYMGEGTMDSDYKWYYKFVWPVRSGQ